MLASKKKGWKGRHKYYENGGSCTSIKIWMWLFMNWENQHALSQGRECICHIFAFQKLFKKVYCVLIWRKHMTQWIELNYGTVCMIMQLRTVMLVMEVKRVRIHEGKVKGCEVCKEHKTVVGFLQKEVSF